MGNQENVSGAIVSRKDLKQLLCYNPDTGVFTWIKSGKIAGTINCNGYTRITIAGGKYLAHRLAFLYMDGALPPDQVDHINRTRLDNRWVNLRHADNSLNGMNSDRSAVNTSGVRGVNFDSFTGRWKARLQNVFLGRFDTIAEAAAARKQAEI